MTCITCGKPLARHSKYCQEHKDLARQKMLAMFADSKQSRVNRDNDFRLIWAAAHMAGQAAVEAEKSQLISMVVEQHANMLNDNSPVVKQWVVAGGSCGYSTLRVTNGVCAFAKWVVKNKLGSKSYYRGINLAAHMQVDGPLIQSYQLNRAYAVAFAEVLSEHAIPVTIDSRED